MCPFYVLTANDLLKTYHFLSGVQRGSENQSSCFEPCSPCFFTAIHLLMSSLCLELYLFQLLSLNSHTPVPPLAKRQAELIIHHQPGSDLNLAV